LAGGRNYFCSVSLYYTTNLLFQRRTRSGRPSKSRSRFFDYTSLFNSLYFFRPDGSK